MACVFGSFSGPSSPMANSTQRAKDGSDIFDKPFQYASERSPTQNPYPWHSSVNCWSNCSRSVLYTSGLLSLEFFDGFDFHGWLVGTGSVRPAAVEFGHAPFFPRSIPIALSRICPG